MRIFSVIIPKSGNPQYLKGIELPMNGLIIPKMAILQLFVLNSGWMET